MKRTRKNPITATQMHLITYAAAAVSAALTLQCTAAGADDDDHQVTPASATASPSSTEIPAYAPAVLREPASATRADEDRIFNEAARAAWAHVDRNYHPATGLVNAQPTWAYPTAWDIASALASFYSARGLGYISDAEYQKRASQLLATMKKARLYNGIAYGRNYDAKTGELVGPDQKPHANGTGWSAMDLGRLLVVLGIVARQDPSLAEAARAVATRVDGSKVVKGGYLIGTEVNPKTKKPESYQEGRLGYEQYAAAGFALWDLRPSNALNARPNLAKAKVLGIPIPADRRGLDRLTSEPFIMHGLELGWNAEMREMAWQTLSAQAARFMKTGQITMASEDAINQPPHYFYYYCVYCSRKPFVINVHTPGVDLNGPRWLSTKAAFAWHALLPSGYTWKAVEAVRPALNAKTGWASGVFEGSRKSTDTYTLNTAALILEAALYRKTGKPLMEQSR
jgi:hypothetical protein